MRKLTEAQADKLDEILHNVFMDNCTQVIHSDDTATFKFDDEDRDNLMLSFRSDIIKEIGIEGWN